MVIENTVNNQDATSGFPGLTPEQQARLDALSEQSNTESSSKYGWDDTTQRKLLAGLMTDPDLAARGLPLVEQGYFSNEVHAAVAGILKAYWDRYKGVPEPFIVNGELAEKTKDRDRAVAIHFQGELESLRSYYVPGLQAKEYLLDKVKEFSLVQKTKMAFKGLVEGMTEHPDQAEALVRKHAAAIQDLLKGTQDAGPKLIDCEELLALPDGEWLVEDHFPTDCVGLVYGKYASLKSFFALETALSVACNQLFLGSHPVRQGAVVYIAGEGSTGLKKRVAAWLKHHGHEKPPKNFKLVFHRFNFADPTEADKLLALVRDQGVSPSLVIVDTLARNMVGSENDAETMNAFISSMDGIREGLGDAKPCVLVVHHAGKDSTRGSRGYSSLPAAVDVSFEMTRSGDGAEVRCEKQKDAEEIDKYRVGTLKVDLGVDAKGRPVNSLVLVPEVSKQPSPVALARMEENQEDDDVLACMPFLTEAEWRANPEQAVTRESISKTLGWDKDKTRNVLERLQRKSPTMKWRKAKEGRTNPYYYWRGYVSGCTAIRHNSIGDAIGGTQ